MTVLVTMPTPEQTSEITSLHAQGERIEPVQRLGGFSPHPVGVMADLGHQLDCT